MTVTELLKGGIEAFNALSGAELQATLKSAQKSVYQRVSRLTAKGFSEVPSVRGLKKSGGFISAAKGPEAQMKSELQRALQFLGAKTSTITGAREYRAKQIEELDIPADTPDDIITEAWEQYHKLQEDYNAEIMEQIFGDKYKDAAHDIVSQIALGADPVKIRDRLKAQYETYQRQHNKKVDRIKNGLRSTSTN